MRNGNGGMRMRYLIVATALALSGCGIVSGVSHVTSDVGKIRASNDYQASVADYRACVAANAGRPQACDSQRTVMDTNERVLNTMSAAAGDGNNIVVQRR